MYKKIIVFALIFSFLLSGCYSWELVQEPNQDSTIRITTKNNEVYEMSDWNEEEECIIGDAGETKIEGKFTERLKTKINKSEIVQIEEEYLNGFKTTLLCIGSLYLILNVFACAYGFYGQCR